MEVTDDIEVLRNAVVAQYDEILKLRARLQEAEQCIQEMSLELDPTNFSSEYMFPVSEMVH